MDLLFTREDLAKYPFSKDAREYIKELNFDYKDFRTPYGQRILERAYSRVSAAIEKRIIPPIFDEDLDVEILSFPTAVLLVESIGDSLLSTRYAIAESKRASLFLRNEPSEKILYLASDTFNWKIAFNKDNRFQGYVFKLFFKDYLTHIPEHSPAWKLSNRILEYGEVLLTKHDAVRLLEEAVKMYILERLSKKIELEDSLGLFSPWIEKLRSSWSRYKVKIEKWKTVDYGEEAYPPCIAALLNDAKAGKNIPHVGRFALAAFLLNIGKTVDEVLEIFRHSPDFNENIARYQVEHIAGLRGSRIRYSPFKCENMKSYGLCRDNGKTCKNIKHPLQYYYRKGIMRKRKHVEEKRIS